MDLITSALLASVSPQTLALVLYLLSGPHGLRNASVFVGAELFASTVTGALVALGIADLGIHVNGIGHGTAFPGVYIGAGVLLLGCAAWVLWRSRHPRPSRHEHTREEAEARLERIAASWKAALGVGLVFGLPSVWLAYALAKTSGHGPWWTTLSLVVFTAIAYSWGWLTILWYVLDRDRAVRRITALRTSVGRHRIAIIVAVLAAVGAYLVGFGVVTA